MQLRTDFLPQGNDATINTIYIGGGTPTSLNEKELTKLFSILKIFKLNEEYNKETFDYICNKTFAHKLTYKLDESIQNNKKNFYNYLVEDKND